jgi:monofunctional biosynthetic peptidoglycan transglycosylase
MIRGRRKRGPSTAARDDFRPQSARRSSAAGRLRRVLVRVLLVLILTPTLVIVAYRFVDPPITPLMLIRLAEGEGLERTWMPLERISVHLRTAVIAAEDNRFCEHHGFDFEALGQEIDAWLAGQRPRGASTITMQTAKNILLWPGRDPVRKILEAWLTPQIELLWSKQRILEVYLNIAETGPGLYGAEAMARAAFAKPAADLGRREAALIAATLPNPREWSAARPTSAIDRRSRQILTRIRQLGPLLDCAHLDD